MCAVVAIVRDVGRHESPEVFGVEHDDVVEDVLASAQDESLRVPVHPRLSSEPVDLDADAGDEIENVAREQGIGIADEASALAGVVWECLAELLQDPCAGRLGGYGEVADLSALVVKDEEDVVPPKEHIVDGEEVHRRKLGRVVAEEGRPGLVGERLGVPRAESGEIAGDSGFTHFEFEAEEFAVDSKGAPCSVLVVQALDGLADRKSDRMRPLRF